MSYCPLPKESETKEFYVFIKEAVDGHAPIGCKIKGGNFDALNLCIECTRNSRYKKIVKAGIMLKYTDGIGLNFQNRKEIVT